MTALDQFLDCIKDLKSNQTLEDKHIPLIEKTVLYVQSCHPINWDDEVCYALRKALDQTCTDWRAAHMSLQLLQSLEPLYAQLPASYTEIKGLLQSTSYTSFVSQILEISPHYGLALLDQGMKNGRHVYTDGENLSFQAQAAIVTRFATNLLKTDNAVQHLVRYLEIFESYHEPGQMEKFCQILLYEAVSNARVDCFDVLMERMSLQAPASNISSTLTREELCSLAWMRKSDQMSSELYNEFLPREQCQSESFDARVWDLIDWVGQHLTYDTAINLAQGIRVLAERLCCMNEDDIHDVLKIKKQPHPIFHQLWCNPLLNGHRVAVVQSVLKNTQTHNLPYNSGCEVAWMLYEQLSEEEKNIPHDLLSVLQQYPPYAKLQLSEVVEHVSPQRFTKKM